MTFTSSYSDISMKERERRVPRAAPMFAMRKRTGEDKRTARFIIRQGSS